MLGISFFSPVSTLCVFIIILQMVDSDILANWRRNNLFSINFYFYYRVYRQVQKNNHWNNHFVAIIDFVTVIIIIVMKP